MSLKLLHNIYIKMSSLSLIEICNYRIGFFGCIYVQHGKILQPIQILLKINSYFKWYMLYTVLLKIQTRWHFIPIIWFYCIQKKTRFISIRNMVVSKPNIFLIIILMNDYDILKVIYTRLHEFNHTSSCLLNKPPW